MGEIFCCPANTKSYMVISVPLRDETVITCSFTYFNVGFAPVLKAMVVAYVTTPDGKFDLELYDNGKGMFFYMAIMSEIKLKI